MTLKIFSILAFSLLSGCSVLHIYTPPITQGNILCDDAIAQLKPGMTAEQVVYLMGTPVLNNTFEPTRWDYVYSYKKGNSPRIERRITLFFNNGILQRIDRQPC